ncbi:MAG: hypothetical protein KF697_04055 [Pseudolabrys sp.]|nr:hypothetical protein [Pseudolabrys sp.]
MPQAVTPEPGASNDAVATNSDLHGIDCHRESSRCDLHPPSCEFYERPSDNPHKMPHGCPTMFAYLRIGKSDPRFVRRKNHAPPHRTGVDTARADRVQPRTPKLSRQIIVWPEITRAMNAPQTNDGDIVTREDRTADETSLHSL